ncbi:hypothetical protein H2200_000902 [Cladophialophora chaetospira]|uniref:Transcription factor domain-containing protein n=1 Tax=Cladophialophora chaetospira TaxID=386627 RepID=A0AA38XQ77_9EURO|nr:hypothetical protein H2200_000902 [Cladophialophora chaetospira]
MARIFQPSKKGIEKGNPRFQFVFKQTRCKESDTPTREALQPVSTRQPNKSMHRNSALSATKTLSLELEGTAPGIEHGAAFPLLIGSVPFYAEAEHAAALQYFLEVPAPRIAYNMAGHFFTVTLPQASLTHPAIMEAMMALATLNATLRGTSSARWTTSPALLHYNKAITTLVLSKPTRIVTLMVCMLLWLYEQFDNQHSRALFHRQSIVNIVAEWRSHELGLDRTMDEYIATCIEPTIITGLEVTAPVKLCREVLDTLQLQLNCYSSSCSQCTYEDAVNSLRACLDCFILRDCGEETCKSDDSLPRASLTSLQVWNYQFEHYTGSKWEVEGPILLAYATAVAMLVTQEAMPTEETRDAEWQRALKFLRGESSKIWRGLNSEEETAHGTLLDGVALIIGG